MRELCGSGDSLTANAGATALFINATNPTGKVGDKVWVSFPDGSRKIGVVKELPQDDPEHAIITFDDYPWIVYRSFREIERLDDA